MSEKCRVEVTSKKIFRSSAMWRCVAGWLVADVSEDCSASLSWCWNTSPCRCRHCIPSNCQ